MLGYKEKEKHEFKTTQLRISLAKSSLKKKNPITSLLTKYFTHTNNSKTAPPILYFDDNKSSSSNPYPSNNHSNNYSDNSFL